MSQLAVQRANAEALVKQIVNALDDKKATDIRVIDITGKTSVADYLVIATGLADQHLRGMRMGIEKTLDEAGVTINGVESQDGSGWTVLGTFEVMVHLFRADQRANYKIEQLWNEGVEIPVSKFLVAHSKPAGYVSVSGNSKPAPAKKTAARKEIPVKAPIVKKALSAKLFATREAVQAKMQAAGRKANNISRKAPTLKQAAAAAKAEQAATAKAPAKKAGPAKAPVKSAAKPATKVAVKPVAKVPAAKAGAAKKPGAAAVKPAAKPVKKVAAKPAAKAAVKAGVVTRPVKKKA